MDNPLNDILFPKFNNIHKYMGLRLSAEHSAPGHLVRDLMHRPSLSIFMKYSSADLPFNKAPLQWVNFVDEKIAAQNYPGNPLNSYLLSTRDRKSYFIQMSLSLMAMQSRISYGTELPEIVNAEMVAKNARPFYRDFSTSFVDSLTEGKEFFQSTLRSISSHEPSPFWRLPLFDVLCIMQLFADICFRDHAPPIAVNGRFDEDHVQNYCEHSINTIQQLFSTDTELPVPAGSLHLLAHILKLIPRAGVHDPATILMYSMIRLQELTGLLSDENIPNADIETHHLADGDFIFRQIESRTPFNRMNNATHPLEQAFRAIEQRDGNAPSFSETRARLSLQQHRVQGITSKQRILTRLERYFNDERNGVTGVAAYAQVGERIDHALGNENPFSDLHGENVNPTRPRAPGPPENLALQAENDNHQMAEHAYTHWDYESFLMIATFLRSPCFTTGDVFASLENFNTFRDEIVNRFKTMYTYCRPSAQGNMTFALDRFLLFLCRIYGQNNHNIPQIMSIFQQF